MKKLINTIKKIRDNKALNIITSIIKYIVWIVLFLVVVIIFIQRFFDSSKLQISGYRIFNVITESMYPEYKVGDIIITKRADFEDINVGDNVTYLGAKNELTGLIVTHQVIEKNDNTKQFITKGINSKYQDPVIDYSQIYGKVLYRTVVLSYISKLMNNRIIYYFIFTIIGILISVDISSGIYEKKMAMKDDLNGKGEDK